MNHRFTLSNTNRFYKYDIIACGFTQYDGFTGMLCHTPKRFSRRRWTNKHIVSHGQGFHAGFVAKYTTAANARTRVNGHYGKPMSLVQQFMSDRLNEGAFSNTRYPGDSNTPGVPTVGNT